MRCGFFVFLIVKPRRLFVIDVLHILKNSNYWSHKQLGIHCVSLTRDYHKIVYVPRTLRDEYQRGKALRKILDIIIRLLK